MKEFESEFVFVANENLWQLGLDHRIMGNKSQERDVSFCIASIHWLLSMCSSRRECMFGDYKTLAPAIDVGDRSFIHVNVKRDFSLFARSCPRTFGPLQIRRNLGFFAGAKGSKRCSRNIPHK